MLPDREAARRKEWLSGQPQISLVARDRGDGKRWQRQGRCRTPHTGRRISWRTPDAFLDAVRKSMRQIRAAIGATTINPSLLTAAERIQYEGYLRREEANAAVLGMAKDGASIKEIVRRTGHSRGLVHNLLRDRHSDVFHARESSLEPHLQWLDAQWAAGHRNDGELWAAPQNTRVPRLAGEAPVRSLASPSHQVGDEKVRRLMTS